MDFDHQQYVPCLRWKQGEYQAVLELKEDTKAYITPLIEVPEIGFDFEKGEPAKSLDDHLEPFAKRIKQKWGKDLCLVDLKRIETSPLLADSRHPLNFVFDALNAEDCTAVPVTGPKRGQAFQRAVKNITARDQRGVCIRVDLTEAAKADLKNSIDSLLSKINLKVATCDLVFDLNTPNFVPVDGFAKLIEAIIERLPYLDRWRTFTLLGTSFPPSMSGIKQGTTTIDRWEWVLYKLLTKRLDRKGIRRPTFGDYAINHPDVLLIDMRIVKPFATIRYTINDAWLIVKGKNVRDNGFKQYRSLCQTLIESPHYAGAEFSWGDRYIAYCADGGKTGNLTTWRKVGTNHHLEKVVRDISNFFGSSDTP